MTGGRGGGGFQRGRAARQRAAGLPLPSERVQMVHGARERPKAGHATLLPRSRLQARQMAATSTPYPAPNHLCPPSTLNRLCVSPYTAAPPMSSTLASLPAPGPDGIFTFLMFSIPPPLPLANLCKPMWAPSAGHQNPKPRVPDAWQRATTTDQEPFAVPIGAMENCLAGSFPHLRPHTSLREPIRNQLVAERYQGSCLASILCLTRSQGGAWGGCRSRRGA